MAFQRITPEMLQNVMEATLRRALLCKQQQGDHFEHLLWSVLNRCERTQGPFLGHIFNYDLFYRFHSLCSEKKGMLYAEGENCDIICRTLTDCLGKGTTQSIVTPNMWGTSERLRLEVRCARTKVRTRFTSKVWNEKCSRTCRTGCSNLASNLLSILCDAEEAIYEKDVQVMSTNESVVNADLSIVEISETVCFDPVVECRINSFDCHSNETCLLGLTVETSSASTESGLCEQHEFNDESRTYSRIDNATDSVLKYQHASDHERWLYLALDFEQAPIIHSDSYSCSERSLWAQCYDCPFDTLLNVNSDCSVRSITVLVCSYCLMHIIVIYC